MIKRYTILFSLLSYSCFAQERLPGKIPNPDKYLSNITKNADLLNRRLQRKTEKLLNRWQRQEGRIHRTLAKIDSASASNPVTQAGLQEQLKVPIPPGGFHYPAANLDSLSHMLTFLNTQPELTGTAVRQLKEATAAMKTLEATMDHSRQVQDAIRSKMGQLKERLAATNALKSKYRTLEKIAYYYKVQMNELTSTTLVKQRLQSAASNALSTNTLYQSFTQQNPLIGDLFAFRQDVKDSLVFDKLQTQQEVQNLMSRKAGNDPAAKQAITQQVGQAKSKLTAFKDRYASLDNTSEIPDFRPNEMRSKRFLGRLEFGGNIQFQKTSSYYPATSDIAGQVGFRFNKRLSAGIGAAFKLGLGSDWNNTAFSNQGLGLRSYLDWKLIRNLSLAGGIETNYLQQDGHIDDLRQWQRWQWNALFGIEKKVTISSKAKGSVSILYNVLGKQDPLSFERIKMRFGYTIQSLPF